MSAERLNEAVREHELAEAWEHQAEARRVYAWFDRFKSVMKKGRQGKRRAGR